MNVTGLCWWSVNIGSGNEWLCAITWANVDSDLCCHMVSLDQNGLIGVIALLLQDIHHHIIVFCNISWIWTKYENKIKYIQFWCTQNYFYMIHSPFHGTVYSRYIADGGVQAMVLRYNRERDISGNSHEPKSGSIFQRVVSNNGAFVCLAVNSARRQRI